MLEHPVDGIADTFTILTVLLAVAVTDDGTSHFTVFV